MAGQPESLTDSELLAAVEEAEQTLGVESEQATAMRSELVDRVAAIDLVYTTSAKALRRTTAAWPTLDVTIEQQLRRVQILIGAGVTRRDLMRGGAPGHVDRLARELGMPKVNTRHQKSMKGCA